jgi:hypothetical protein
VSKGKVGFRGRQPPGRRYAPGMASSPVPDALAMKRIKYDPAVPDAERDRLAAALRAAGRRSEAILLFEGRGSDPSLRQDVDWAVSIGASFTLSALRRMGVEISDEKLRACAQNAEAKGRWYDAFRCYERLADAEAVARVKEHIPGFALAVPENKK